ncbi:MAG: NAD(P)/FAD-dependent oxidoreductase [Alphaproteobacteria bacterium]|nr:NAD(P)/FAD-dependent oxidoreductase [Alphaproteobacteria bacterium]
MAGARTVEALVRRAPSRYDITVFGAEAHASYNRVLLSGVLAGEKTAAEIFTHSREWYASHGVALHTGDPVVAVDAALRTVTSQSGRQVSYDKLVLATGSRPLAPSIPGLDLAGVSAFRDIKDVDAMIGAAARYRRAVVIGGGLLGLEAAWGLRRRGMAVTAVHLMPTLMERQLDATAGQLLQHDLERRGIAFVTNGDTEEIYGDGHVEGVRLANGRDLPADFVVMAVGICPETGLARQAGLDVNRGIVVDDGLRSSDPAIYAVGECAEHRGLCFGLVAPVWDMAETCAARLAGDRSAFFATSVLSAQLKITGVEVFSAGALMAEAESDDEITYLDAAGGTYRKLVLRDDTVVGAVLYGDVTDGAWYLRLIRQAADVSQLRAELIFGPSVAVPSGEPVGHGPAIDMAHHDDGLALVRH